MGSAAQIPKPGDTVAGKYLLEAMLGQGGMGAVFRARHTLTDRKVALKWMLPDQEAGDAAVQRFLREARAMGRIDHPAVVGVLDIGVEGDAAYLVMELLRGSSLRDRMEAAGKLAPAEAIQLLLPAMEGLAAAHAAGVVHRDIKPDNLFCVTGGGTKVLDFGVSKLHGDRFGAPGTPGSGGGPITHTGAMVGTPAYMAPEQVRGERSLDARTDVWALGAILYEALSGTIPFDHETLGQTIVAIATTAPPRLESLVPGIPLALADVVHRALEKDLSARWPNVESFAQALLPFSSGATFTAPRPSSVRPPPPGAGASGEIGLEMAETGLGMPTPALGGVMPSEASARRATGVGTMARERADATGERATAATSPKTSSTSATPFVSSGAHRLVAPAGSNVPWGWITAGISLLALAITIAFTVSFVRERDASRAALAATPPAPSLATAPAASDAGTDAALEVVAAPVVEPTAPSADTVEAEAPTQAEAPVHATRPRPPRTGSGARAHATETSSATAPPPSTTAATAAPSGGRTGRLSRDDF